MPFDILAFWTPTRCLELIAGFGMVTLILFAITLFLVAGFYVVRVVGAYLRARRSGVLQERAAVARQAGSMAWLAIVCGPLFGVSIFLIVTPFVMLETGFRRFPFITGLFTSTGLGTLAGLIAAGAFWASSTLLGQVRKTSNKGARGALWDAELDAPG